MTQNQREGSPYLPMLSGVTVREALRLGALSKARVVAGHGGLDNIIRYVSVIEVPDAVRWFQGYELMITAAYSYRHSEEALVQLVEDLVCADAAALAICYSQRYLGTIPQKVIDRANELNFPILELPLDVKYIEIITPVLTAIVNRQAQHLDLALRTHLELENLVIKGAGLEAMVRRIAELLETPVLLLAPTYQARCLAVPEETLAGLQRVDWRAAFASARPDVEHGSTIVVGEVEGISFAAVALGTHTLVLGHLVSLGMEELDTTRFLLSQCSMPLTVELLMERSRQEAELRLQRDFFEDLFNGEMSSEVAARRAKAYGIDLSGCSCVVVADIDSLAQQFLKSGEESKVQTLKEELKRIGSALVEEEARGGLVVSRSDSMVILPRFPGLGREEVLARAKRLARRVCLEAADRLAPATVSVGVGAYCAEVGELWRGFRTAQGAIEIGRRLSGPSSVHCWDDLGPYQLLLTLKGSNEAAGFVRRNLAPLLENSRSEELLSTLEAVLAYGGNVERAAARLHLHRNTVRYRLEQMRRLLGRDPLAHPFEMQLALALRKLL